MTAAREGRGRIAGQAGPLAGAGSAAACLRASTATTSGEQLPAAERRGHPGDHLRGGHPPVQQQHLDQRLRPGGVAVPGPGRGPERLVALVNAPAARACASAAAPGSAPGLRTRISR